MKEQINMYRGQENHIEESNQLEESEPELQSLEYQPVDIFV